jgi:RimJ/RimL family protein N-acetyltransferase
MAEEVNFRLAEPGDAQAVLDLLKQLQLESNTFLVDADLNEITSEMEANQIRLIGQSKQNLIALAETDGKLVGIVTVDGVKETVGELGVAVLSDFQGYTLGSSLVELAIDWAIHYSTLSQLVLTVFADNLPAVHIYQKYGFATVQRFSKNHRQLLKMVLVVSTES